MTVGKSQFFALNVLLIMDLALFSVLWHNFSELEPFDPSELSPSVS